MKKVRLVLYNGKSVVAIIPARAGSKGLAQKNIKILQGKPLMAWTVEQAHASKCFDRVIVSTEDQKISQIAKEYNAEVPFVRPQELATDEAKGIEVLLHAMNWLAQHQEKYDLVCLLQSTSPLRNAEDIIQSFELFFKINAEAIVTVCEAEHSPLWINTIGEDLSMKDFLKTEFRNKNRQDLGKFYRLNGALYLAKWEYLIENNGFFGKKTYAYIMPRERSVDIDDSFDFKIAEFLLKERDC